MTHHCDLDHLPEGQETICNSGSLSPILQSVDGEHHSYLPTFFRFTIRTGVYLVLAVIVILIAGPTLRRLSSHQRNRVELER
jgi:hypothetical protein